MKRERTRQPTVVVIGLGTFGSETAKTLFEGGAAVLAIDSIEGKIDAISSSVTHAVCADATNMAALRRSGAFDADIAVIALRRHFDTSVLVTHTLKKEGVAEILVQVDTEQEADAIRAVGATSVIFPERDMAERIARRILVPGLADRIPLGGNVAIIEVPIPDRFAGKSLIDLDVQKNYGVIVIAIKSRQGTSDRVEVAPAPSKPLKAGDSLMLVGKTDKLESFRNAIAS
jgi:trk system potassium uptake protein TrkA